MLFTRGALLVKCRGTPLLLQLRCHRQNQRGAEPINKVKTNHDRIG